MVILSSEEFVKSLTNVSDNIQGKFIGPALREAQDCDLEEVIGTAMTQKLQDLVENDAIGDSGNTAYKALLDKAQYFMAYTVIARLIPICSYKIDNIGATTTSDDRVQNLSMDDIFKLQAIYQDKADFYRDRLQRYILQHRAELPEICENKCLEIQANLYSAASNGIWLGGPRGNGYGRYWGIRHIGYDNPEKW